jgi:C-terminal processing protease CtpA/Prc
MLHVGELVYGINGTSTVGMSSDQALLLIAEADSVELTICVSRQPARATMPLSIAPTGVDVAETADDNDQ